MLDVYKNNYITNQEKEQAKEEGAMNKQEVIDKLKAAIPDKTLDDYQRVEEIALTYALGLIEELGKVTVPQFVAEFYESIKDDFEEGVYDLFVEFYEYEYRRELDAELYQWFKLDGNKPIETLVMMHKFGYEVDEEVEECNQKH